MAHMGKTKRKMKTVGSIGGGKGKMRADKRARGGATPGSPLSGAAPKSAPKAAKEDSSND